MKAIHEMHVKIFADGADKSGMLDMYKNTWIKGFTTNPTLMQKAGINDYEKFARDIVSCISDRPISFEVFSDDFSEMYLQAIKISQFGKNVYVKIPITNTKGESSVDLIRELANEGVKQNVTALMTLQQVESVNQALAKGPAACISVFAGRIADTGRDPLPIMKKSLEIMSENSQLELIWASPRELLNIVQADEIGCHIITVTNDLLKKLSLIGKDLNLYSLETVQMFRTDAVNAGFKLTIDEIVTA
ncbi:MAG TPA: transaldolase [Coxiellaceae bacterium]|nr:MAG: transaldolase [Gammaproteobacteria bacterium RIFCSPHIGHO2_12_FULL_36_30]HLB55905.1 transaldolase [Coxiellaceae bacterium]